MGGGASVHRSTEATPNIPKQPKKSSIHHELRKEFGNTSKQKENQLDVIKDEDETLHMSVPSTSKANISLNPAVFKAKRLFMKPILKKRPVARKVVIKKQNNSAILREMFRRLDPSLPMSNINFVTGEIEVAVKYKLLQEVLLVKIGRAKRLKTDVMGRPSPYVTAELYMENDREKSSRQCTATKEMNSDPNFNEILSFPLDERQLAHSKVNLSMWSSNSIGFDDFLGEVILDVCKLDLNAGENEWYQLRPKIDDSITGSIDVSLKLIPPNVVAVTLHEANNLKVANKLSGSSSPFAKIHVTGLPHRMETKVIEKNLNPEWNERFEFLIHKDEFPKRIVVVNVMSREGNQLKRLGDVHVPLCDFDESVSGERHTYCLRDLRHTPYVRSKWVEEGIAIELHEAMRAHATYALPSFIYKPQHQGKMLLSVRNMQAKAQANLVIVNGVPSEEHA